MMGLSGIGFALRSGAVACAGATVNIPTNDAKAALLAYIDAAVLNLALTPLLRATDPVRDLVILDNRLHTICAIRSPAMRAEAQFIGRGGISLAIVESAVISGNHVNDNGVSAIDPVCGVFIGYGNNVEITDNVLAGNGAITADYEAEPQAGLRGGFYVRFAGALTTQFSTIERPQAGAARARQPRRPAGRPRADRLRVRSGVLREQSSQQRDSRGSFGFIDTLVGSVLLLNLGGIHRLIARLFGRYLYTPAAYTSLNTIGRAGSFAARAEALAARRRDDIRRQLRAPRQRQPFADVAADPRSRRPRVRGEHGVGVPARSVLRQRGARRRHVARDGVALPRGCRAIRSRW